MGNADYPVPQARRPLEVGGRRHRAFKKGFFFKMAYWVRERLISAVSYYYRKILKMDLHPGCRFSLKANLDKTNPRGVHVDDGTYIAFGAVVLSHDMSRASSAHTRIGKNCFIGAHAIIMPGVVIGDECIVGSGAVVTRDVLSHSVVVGNPAKVVKSGVRTTRMGVLIEELESARKLPENQSDNQNADQGVRVAGR